MQKFTSSNVGTMEAEMIAVLNKHGFKNVTFTGNTRSFSSTETTFKIVANIDGAQTSVQADLELHAQYDNLDITKVGPKGEVLVAYHSRKRSYPYIMRRGTKEYKLSPSQARGYFGV